MGDVRSVAQRFVLQTPAVAALIIGVCNQDRIAESSRMHTFSLRAVVAKRKGLEGDL